MNKNIYSIPACLPFSDVLAEWILKKYGTNPLDLPRVLVLLPSRRACLSLREAFLRVTAGRPTLLPRMQPIGEVDADILLALPDVALAAQDMPHPAFASKRLFMLAHLVRAYQSNAQGKRERMDHALYQAREIASLLDKIEREGATLANLATLTPEVFAAHWQLTTEFLNIVAQHWPAIVEQQGLISPEQWRNQVLLTLVEAWKAAPPDYPVIAAGTTGSIPSTAALLKVIAALPQGAVVLPGLDMQASKPYMDNLTESHPGWGMHELLALLGVARHDVEELGTVTTQGRARMSLLSRALCPAEMLDEWRQPDADITQAVQGLMCVASANQQEEAASIALMLREVLEVSGKTAALVTHDRALARRVSAEMRRFSIQIDDSAGQVLAETPAMAFLRLVLEVAESNANPVKLLALLKHPLTHLGLKRIECLEAVREFEKAVLRGVCPAFGLDGLRASVQKLTGASPSLSILLDALETRMGALITVFSRAGSEEFSILLETHLHCAEALAGEGLWQGREADALVVFIHELRDAAVEAGMIEILSYPSVFDALLVGRVVRPDYGMHPRLKILSPMEARMQSFDRIIIGGLNEGSWPPQVGADPWFNRPMRVQIGLSLPERQIGQAAHDFMMLASAPEVFITRAQKVSGTPTTPARWWVRLMTLLEHCCMKQQVQQNHYTQWAQEMDACSTVKPCVRPAPVPPVAARPHEVAVTQVEKWLADPYAFYARNILKLKRLDDINQNPTAADFGNKVHDALQKFVDCYPDKLPPDPLDALLRNGRDIFAAYDFYPIVKAWWWPRFEQVAAWMMAQEKEVRPSLSHVWAEVKGRFTLEGITFTGRADRMEETKQGELGIIDYKTGGAHSKTETREGNAVQLMLLALMAQEGAWDADIAAKHVVRLEYWIAGGGRNAGEIRQVDKTQIAEYVAIAKEKLTALIAHYQNPARAYICAVGAYDSDRRGDYEHLARVQEWR